MRSEPLKPQPKIVPIETPKSALLSAHVKNYKPADSHMTLEQQVFECKARKCDSIEATDEVFLSVFGDVPETHYAVYKNVKLYKIGHVEKGQALDNLTIEQKLFGKP